MIVTAWILLVTVIFLVLYGTLVTKGKLSGFSVSILAVFNLVTIVSVLIIWGGLGQ